MLGSDANLRPEDPGPVVGAVPSAWSCLFLSNTEMPPLVPGSGGGEKGTGGTGVVKAVPQV